MNTKRISVMRTGMAALLAAALAGAAAATETLENGGKLANPGAETAGTARSMALNAAYVGVAEGAEAVQWNPAGLGNLATPEAGWHHLSGLAGTTAETVIVGLSVGKLGGLALSGNILDNGRIESRDSVGTQTGSYDAGTVGGSLGWGYALSKDLAIGAAFHGARQTIATMRYDSFAADAGALWKTPVAGLTAGAAVANIGGSGSASDLAMVIRAGASWAGDLGADNRLLLAGAVGIEPGGVNLVNVGVEDSFMKHLAIRAGYSLNLADQKLSGLSGLSAGLGVEFAHCALDYAYLPFGDLGNLQRVSLTYRRAPETRGQVAEGGAP